MEDGGSNLCMQCNVTLPDAYRCCLDRSSGQPLASASRIDLSASSIACEQGAMSLQT